MCKFFLKKGSEFFLPQRLKDTKVLLVSSLEFKNLNLPEFALGIEAVSFYEVERNKRYSRKPDRRERPKKNPLISERIYNRYNR
jgi:hypothetical protein